MTSSSSFSNPVGVEQLLVRHASIASLPSSSLKMRRGALAVDDAQVGDDAASSSGSRLSMTSASFTLAKRRTSAALWSKR